ncbi:MAG TPA: hypothetical protein VG405_09745 [Solirubrobacteraceae bacterium]|jgi:hypothetical protein|nr:hypothetical protein [Solirubrobacteraceae bacterium]
MFAASRALVRIAFRDPENIPERLALVAVERLGEPSRSWAEGALAEPDAAEPSVQAERLRGRSARLARLDGAIAGTPFLVALIPAYIGYLWQEASMVLRMAALFGHDPRRPRAAAELLALRGLHADVEAAERALERVRRLPLPAKPERRRPLRSWMRAARRVLVFGGFLENRAEATDVGKVKAALGLLLSGSVWILTWVFPVTLMLAMAWSCERHTRQLGDQALACYAGITPGGARPAEIKEHPARRAVRSVALILSIAVPVAFVAYADHVRKSTGISWIAAVGALVGLSVVIAAAVVARSR